MPLLRWNSHTANQELHHPALWLQHQGRWQHQRPFSFAANRQLWMPKPVIGRDEFMRGAMTLACRPYRNPIKTRKQESDMSHVFARAITLAASHFVDDQLINFDADELYPRMKQLATEGNCLIACEITDFTVSAEYQSLTVTELVERVEVAANQMMAFGKLMLEAAHSGLVEAAIDGSLDSDANTWHLPSLAEAHI